MRLIRQDNGAVIDLPYDLYPVDEFNYSKVTSNQKYALDGTLIVQTAIKKAGKPITLQADEDLAHVTRATLSILLHWAEIENLKMWYERELNGQIQQTLVSFNHQSNPIEARPVKGFNSPNADDWFHVKINLIEVQS